MVLKDIKRDKLEQLLGAKSLDLITKGVVDIKTFEIEFQDVIEKYTGQIWWKITNYFDIYWSLLGTRDPKKTIEEIIGHIKTDEHNNIIME